MASFNLLSLPLPPLTRFSLTSTTHLSSLPFRFSTHTVRRPHKTLVFGINPSQNESSDSKYFDKNGVVQDMDAYLNHLSLEYDSVWDTKPSWCQPWTITLSGASIIGCSWLTLHSVTVTAIASVLICFWWYIFLYSYPQAYSEMIAERRKRVSTGVEDIYGFEEEETLF